MNILDFIEFFLKYYSPILVANASPVLVSEGKPIDFGKKFFDGKRILGDGKTWEGLVIGTIIPLPIVFAISLFYKDLRLMIILLPTPLLALLGDIMGSFVKRRLGLERGAPLPPLDQLDFILVPTLYYYFIGVIGSGHTVEYILLLMIVVFVMHLISNFIAYLLKLKKTPW